MSSKGKAIDKGKAPATKRKGSAGNDKAGRKRRKSAGIQFFEDAAYEVNGEDEESSSDDDGFGFLEDEFLDDEVGTHMKGKSEPLKFSGLPFIPKEEVIDEEEYDRMMEERYRSGSGFVRFAEYGCDDKATFDSDFVVDSARDPVMWKVKCVVGRERQSAFCLIQKFYDMKTLGSKLNIFSAIAVEHVKGFIFIEADKQFDIAEACKGLPTIYYSRTSPVPRNEVSHLLAFRSKHSEVSEGMWVRVKNGKYKGDLAQIVAVNNARNRATVKLIPRIDLQAMAEKMGNGVSIRKAATPAPRLITSSELEEFRPLIQYRRDRETGLNFEILDGLMLKDGYLYKRVSLDSLNCWGVTPLENELLKFSSSGHDDSGDMEWLSQLYGDKKQKDTIKRNKANGKGEASSSGPNMDDGFNLYDLVCFGRRDFGVIVNMEKGDIYKILKEGPEGPVVVAVKRNELKCGPSDIRFTALDKCRTPVSTNDTVRVSEGPCQEKQGIVKKIYRGVIFLCDENETENGGYFCVKSHKCEKIKLSSDLGAEKGGESGPAGFEDFSSSPKSPLSPKRSWLSMDNQNEFKQDDKYGMFSVGQTLRIRVGPLKGYICRVLAIRYSDITVKLDSQQRVLTVKGEHLTEVRAKGPALTSSDDPASGSSKPFDLLGTGGSSGDWMNGVGTSSENEKWNAGGATAERGSWPAFPSGTSVQPESEFTNPSDCTANDFRKDSGGDAWAAKENSTKTTDWGTFTGANNTDQGNWGRNEGDWSKTGTGGTASSSWDKATGSGTGSSKEAVDNWSKANLKTGSDLDSEGDAAAWGKNKNVESSNSMHNQPDSWGMGKNAVEAGSWEENQGGWKQSSDTWTEKEKSTKTTDWGNFTGASKTNQDNWGRNEGGWSKTGPGGTASSSWGKATGSGPDSNQDAVNNWSKANLKTGSALGSEGDAAASWGKNKNVENNNSMNKQPDLWGKGKDALEAGSWEKNQGGWKQSSDAKAEHNQDTGKAWGVEKNPTGSSTANWGDENAVKNQPDSWGKGKGIVQTDSWENNKNSSDKVSGWNQQNSANEKDVVSGSGSAWGRALESGDKSTDCKLPEDLWGKAAEKWGNKNATETGGWGAASQSRGQTAKENTEEARNLKVAKHVTETQTGGWGNLQSSNKKVTGWLDDNLGKQSQIDSWGKPKESGPDGGSSWSKQAGGSSWSKQDGGLGAGWGKSRADGGEKQDSGWKNSDTSGGSKSNWNSGITNSSGERPSRWGQKGNWNSGSGADQDSSWGKRASWSGENQDNCANQVNSWGKTSTWNSGSSADQDSSWGKRASWSGENQDNCADQVNCWGKTSTWNSGNGNNSMEGGSGDDDMRSGGNWRGGRGGRGGPGRGSFRGRGDFGGRGGFGRGFGGRRGSSRGGFGGRDNREFGGQGYGRREQSSGWNSRDDSGEENPPSWGKGTSGNGWGQDATASSNASGGTQWSSWNQANKTKDVGSWGGSDSSKEATGDWDEAKKEKEGADGNQSAGSWGGWGKGSDGNVRGW